MQTPRLTPPAYRRITFVAAVAVGFIIVTGGAVRLTGSGLGCPDWPTCESNRVVAPLEYHAMVEFVNRTITGLVSVAVIVAVLGALTVLFDLKPQFVMAHFLLSLVLLADAVVLHYRAGQPDGGARTPVVP